jgi:hypothetical protein
MGGILNIRWAHNGIVSTGIYCTAQGVIAQFGELGVCLITLVRIFSLCPCARGQLIHILSDSFRPHIRSGNVGSGIESTWLRSWPGSRRIHLLCALGRHRRWYSRSI